MSKPDDGQIFDLFARLKILPEEDAEKARVRFREVSRGLPLLDFLLDGGYLGRMQIARLQAMRKSGAGDLYDDERATLDHVCEQVPDSDQLDDPEDTAEEPALEKGKTLVAIPPPQQKTSDEQGDSSSG